jgi:hypothetical protein
MPNHSKLLSTQIWKIDSQLNHNKKLNAAGQPKGSDLTPDAFRELEAQRDALVKGKEKLAEEKLKNQTSEINSNTMAVGREVANVIRDKFDEMTAKLAAYRKTKTGQPFNYIGCVVQHEGTQFIVEKTHAVPNPGAPWEDVVQYLLIRKDCFDEYKKQKKEADATSAGPPSKSLKYEQHEVVSQEVFSHLVKDLYAPGVVVRTAEEHLTIPVGWVGKLFRKSKSRSNAYWKVQFVVNGQEVLANFSQANLTTTFADADEGGNEYSEEFLRGKVVTFIKDTPSNVSFRRRCLQRRCKDGQQSTRPTGRPFLLKGVEGRSEGFQTKNT